MVGGGPAGTATAIGCASAGKETLLLEKGPRDRHKPCGGVLPLVAPETIEDIVGAPLPEAVSIDPKDLGLYYVPPSGRHNSGRVSNYRIHNIDRDALDQWLRDLSEDCGVEVRYNTQVTRIDSSAGFEVRARTEEREVTLRSEYLIGADGVRSTVRLQIFPEKKVPVMIVGQEQWHGEGDFENCFYGFFRSDISISYAYLIPKGETLLIGLGAVPNQEPSIADLLRRLRNWLSDEFSFVPGYLVKREAWAIPFGYFMPGVGNALLVGDAAGLCNPLSGEGIRLAVESAAAASAAIVNPNAEGTAADRYASDIKGLAGMVAELNRFVRELDDPGRERFVGEELSRRHS